jgi:hypothetical protein
MLMSAAAAGRTGADYKAGRMCPSDESRINVASSTESKSPGSAFFGLIASPRPAVTNASWTPLVEFEGAGTQGV